MTAAAWATSCVVVAMFALMVRGTSPAIAVVGALVALLSLGVVDERRAFAGFANAAPMTVAALYVVARAVERSGVLRPLLRGAVVAGEAPVRGLLRLLVPSAAASAFLNNTPILAVLMPGILRASEAQRVPPSRTLMPLSFAVVLGGVATTLGTSTNLVVSGLLDAAGGEPLGVFEISRVGAPLAALGVALLAWTAPRLLPDRDSPRSRLAAAEREFVVRMLVDPRGPLVGRTVEAARLRSLERVFLAQIERAGEPLAPATPETVLQAGDHLLFVGEARDVAELRAHAGLVSAEHSHLLGLDGNAHGLVEVVLGPASPLLGRTPKEVGFRARYGAAIVGIHREGAPVAAKLGAVKLRLGDTLLLLADEGFSARWSDRPDFVVVADDDATPVRPRGV
ncbi:MAG: SLC13 family permease, partial [Myxococcales bacterium]|nr:SLC13 family permease [Myxococcales bacterium]